MVPITSPRRTSKAEAPAAPTTFAEVASLKMAASLTTYRAFVARAAVGESLDAEELGQVLELLAYLRLPETAWDRDVAAQRDYANTIAAIAQSESTTHAEEQRLAAVTERIKDLEEQLKALRGEYYTLATVAPMTRVGNMQRRNELAANHPHLFLDVADAVRLRQEARDKAAGLARKQNTTEPKTSWSVG